MAIICDKETGKFSNADIERLFLEQLDFKHPGTLEIDFDEKDRKLYVKINGYTVLRVNDPKQVTARLYGQFLGD